MNAKKIGVEIGTLLGFSFLFSVVLAIAADNTEMNLWTSIGFLFGFLSALFLFAYLIRKAMLWIANIARAKIFKE